MRPRSANVDRKHHPEAARDAMDEIKGMDGDPRAVHHDIRYMEPNRDRALGEADRTGRHFDEDISDREDGGTSASEEHEPD